MAIKKINNPNLIKKAILNDDPEWKYSVAIIFIFFAVPKVTLKQRMCPCCFLTMKKDRIFFFCNGSARTLHIIFLKYILQEKSVWPLFSKGEVRPGRGNLTKVGYHIVARQDSPALSITRQKRIPQQNRLTEEAFNSFHTNANALRSMCFGRGKA